MTREQIKARAIEVLDSWKTKPAPLSSRVWEGLQHAAKTGELINNERGEVESFLFYNGAS